MKTTEAKPINLDSDTIDRSQRPVFKEEDPLDSSFVSPNERPLEEEDLVYWVADTGTAYTFRRYNWQTAKESVLPERLLSVLQSRNIYSRSVLPRSMTNKQMETYSAPLVPQLKKWREIRLMKPKLVLFFYSEFDKKLYVKEMNAAKNKTAGSEASGGLFARKKVPEPEVTANAQGDELNAKDEGTVSKSRGRKPKTQ